MHDRRHIGLTLCSIVVVGVSAVALASLAGCGGGDGRPDRVPVEVVVTYNDEPVEGVHVTFAPVGDDGHEAFGKTGPDGTALLSTFGDNDGAVPGSYEVGVRKTDIADPEPWDPEKDGEMPAGFAAKRPTEFKENLPGKYASPSESGLEATVTEGEKNTFRFDLED